MNVPLIAGGEEKAAKGLVITERQNVILYYTKVVAAVIFFIAAVVGFALVLADPAEFDLQLITTTDYRAGDSPQAGIIESNYPTIQLRPISFSDGVSYVGIAAAFGSAMPFIGIMINIFFHEREVQQMNLGSNPFIWIFFIVSHVPLILVAALVAGVHNVYLLSYIPFSMILIYFIYWSGDLLNSYAYRMAVMQSSRNMWIGTQAVFAAITFLASVLLTVPIFIYLAKTFNSGLEDMSSELIAIPIVLLILYLAHWFINLLAWQGWLWVNSLYAREMTYYIVNIFIALIVTFLSIGLFTTDELPAPLELID